MARKKKQEVDIDELIESRVEALLSERLSDMAVDVPDDAPESIDKILCKDCIYWERSSYQEDNTRVNGICHNVPMLPQRKATDWCCKGEKA